MDGRREFEIHFKKYFVAIFFAGILKVRPVELANRKRENIE
jgi:hypothetical protein